MPTSGKRLLCLLLLAGGLLLASACGTARRGVPLVGDREIEDPVLLLGRQTFDANCQQCHPGGTSGIGPALNNKPLPGFAIRMQVRNGVGAMPSYTEKEISDEALEALVAYLKWLRNLPPAAAHAS